MTENEAIKRCDMLINGMSINNATNRAFEEDGKDYPTFATMKEFAKTCKKALEKVQQFEAIGTIEEFKALKEKDNPKKPLFSTIHGDSAYHCSSCKKFVGFYDTRIYEYCHNCGQLLDWSE